MSKLSKLIKGVGLILKNPWLLNYVINSDEEQKKWFEEKYGVGKKLKVVDLLTLFPDFEETVVPFSFAEGGSTPLDLALLRKLCKRNVDTTYFEIGTWRGESVANVSPLVAKAFTLNLADEDLLKLNLPKEYVAQHRLFSKDLKNATHLFGNSSSFDFAPYYKSFDVVFVDGDHHYEAVKKDTENAFKLLRNEKSVIVWHDYGNTPADIRYDVLNGIMDGTPNEFRNKLYRVSNTLCAIFIQDQINAIEDTENRVPNKVFEINLKAKSIS